MEWFFVIFFGIIAFILGIVVVVLLHQNKEWKDNYNNLERVVHTLQEQPPVPDDLKWYDEKVKSFENRIVELNERIEEKEGLIKKYTDTIKDLTNKSYKLAIALDSLMSTVARTREEYDVLNQQKIETLKAQKVVEEALQASKTAASECEKDVINLKKELKDLCEQKRLAILYQDELKDGLWEFSITPKENELISILERIKSDYPELKSDISSIEWRKIWLVKAQDLTNEHNLACSGIYRLILKSDENICYVGQAVNIKDRWYQHIKKMIGVDVKGGEKLYNYRPEDFYWTVVEFTNQANLNEREHYWIEYFGCKEKGLNRKA